MQPGGKPIRNIYMPLEGADALALMTAHREFRELGPAESEGAHAHADCDRWQAGV